MKKILICLTITMFFALASASAQNFSGNDNQKAGNEYERQATAAMSAGDYENAAKLADLASVEYRKSREYANMMLLKFRAANAINLAQSTITDLESHSKTKAKYPNELANAKRLLTEARARYGEEKWEEARSKAMESLDALKGIKGGDQAQTASETQGLLPRYYTVVSRPENTDCFWNIAKMPSIYGDPLLWQKLWKENTGKMKNADDPNLIYPGMVIEIPSIANETREGTYDPSKTYPAFTK